VAALIVGGLLLVLQMIVIFTHFCTLSWMYEGVMRLLGKWHELTSTDDAVALLNNGAMLVDVRTPKRSPRPRADRFLSGTAPVFLIFHATCTHKGCWLSWFWMQSKMFL
jgi:hypothetical protein